MRQVVKRENVDTICIDNVRDDKIYITANGHYKLHRTTTNPSQWVFISLHDSYCGSRGKHSTMREAILTELNAEVEVVECDSFREFVNYLIGVRFGG